MKQSRNTTTAARLSLPLEGVDQRRQPERVVEGVAGDRVREDAERPGGVAEERDHVAIGGTLRLAEAQERLQHVGVGGVEIFGLALQAHGGRGGVDAGQDAAPQRVPLRVDVVEAALGRGSDSVSALR